MISAFKTEVLKFKMITALTNIELGKTISQFFKLGFNQLDTPVSPLGYDHHERVEKLELYS